MSATSQYLSYTNHGEVVDVDVTIAVEGHANTQARAVCHVADREVLTVNAALGDRDIPEQGHWETLPDNSHASLSLRSQSIAAQSAGTITEKLDHRMVKDGEWEELAFDVADATQGGGLTLMWARIPDVIANVDATRLAVLSDFVPIWVGQALGRRGGGNSLDNTLRVCWMMSTDLVLMDIRVHVVAHTSDTDSSRCLLRAARCSPLPVSR
ncbi:MAG: hypothetical protein P8J30_01750 [Ilumatobacter sp.]|nr:hypothetical protein [Ilumatobacter sp.]